MDSAWPNRGGSSISRVRQKCPYFRGEEKRAFEYYWLFFLWDLRNGNTDLKYSQSFFPMCLTSSFPILLQSLWLVCFTFLIPSGTWFTNPFGKPWSHWSSLSQHSVHFSLLPKCHHWQNHFARCLQNVEASQGLSKWCVMICYASRLQCVAQKQIYVQVDKCLLQFLPISFAPCLCPLGLRIHKQPVVHLMSFLASISCFFLTHSGSESLCQLHPGWLPGAHKAVLERAASNNICK